MFVDVENSLPIKQQQILDATVLCVKRWGIERFTINDVMREANVARSTIYKYYQSKEEIIRHALLQSAYQFGEKLFIYIGDFDTAEERMIESMLYAFKSLPEEPSLALISDATFAEILREHMLTTEAGVDIASALMTVILQDDSYSKEELQEVSETVMRMMLSMLTLHSPSPRTDDQMRGYIARRLLPSVGLKVSPKYDSYGRFN